MKKSSILLSSILLFWACKENVESTPACNPKAIPALGQHLVGKWNMVSHVNYDIGMKSPVEFNNDGTIKTSIEFADYIFIVKGLVHDFFAWKVGATGTKSLFIRPYEKGSDGYTFEYQPTYISCDRVDFYSNPGNISLYKDNYQIQQICGADTSKGDVENWLIGKWNYTIVQEPNYYSETNLIRTPKGVVEFKNDFTLTDSNPYGIVDAMTAQSKSTWIKKPINFIWFKAVNETKEKFFIFGDRDKDGYYQDTGTGVCILQSVSCDKIVFQAALPGHEITLVRVK
jgi:hypothetical protein